MTADIHISKKKIVYSIIKPLRKYLRRYEREVQLPLGYQDLMTFRESMPVTDKNGVDTLWETAIYPGYGIDKIHTDLKYIYAQLKAGGDLAVQEHLFIERIDYCTFGNTNPFRIRIVNKYNDNFDYFYIKVADASRVYGLELEHILSPNTLNYLVSGNTIVEEHIAGIPGDQFPARYRENLEYNPRRIVKEFVKFNERCMIRLLGDMRAYNFVVDVTPDFDDFQFRIRPIDFDQQAYEGQLKVYRPQFFKENIAYVQLAMDSINEKVLLQYQKEERSVIVHRMRTERARLAALRDALSQDTIAPPEKVIQLRNELFQFYGDKRFLRCEKMADILEWSLKRLVLGRARGQH